MSHLNHIDSYVSFQILLTAMKKGEWDANGIINLSSKQSSIEKMELDRSYHNCVCQMQMIRWGEAGNSINKEASLSKKASKSFRFIIKFSTIMPENT